MPASTLTERFTSARPTWLETARPRAAVLSRAASVVFIPRLQRKHPLKSRMSGIVY